ncbi:tyrosine-protein phosphatase [Romboutsia sp.]|uniref:tyrosine-protein phosphatase n=1 Tax=Romboutsia sp. TaxID=1965302 RepID=UPI002D024D34|nr:CpsB/CapC family capsule biosynthesis tyrosine phosphatase [Romboutsia sp.]HSQ87831.1 CpsB/CapC family capsule biosynthesis tyrosine phosphatase [Romboutsia sp.]
MIDIHCHILPGVDDGSKDLNDSLEMARIAQREGIKTIINTSHYHPDFDYAVGEKLLEELVSFNKALRENDIDIEVLIGNELYYSDNLLEYMDKKEFYTLNNSKYILIEFAPNRFPKNLCDVVYELKIRGYIPILAHVERYHEIQENPKLIQEAIKEGALIQVNVSSVLGKGPSSANKSCEALLRHNMVHFIGTDAHGSDKRRPLIKEAYEYVFKKYGEDRANRLFLDNPSSVINNEDIILIELAESAPKRSFLAKIFKRN